MKNTISVQGPRSFLTKFSWLSIALALWIGTSLNSPAFAQDNQTRLKLQKLGDCLIAGQESVAWEFEQKPTPAEVYQHQSGPILSRFKECFRKSGIDHVALSPWDIDGLVSDSLAKYFFGITDPGDLSTIAGGASGRDDPIPEIDPISGDRSQLIVQFKNRLTSLNSAYIIGFAECVVRNDSGLARSLFLTAAGSPDEDKAFEALQPSFAACSPNKTNFQLTKFSVRAWLAINYFKLAAEKMRGVQS